MIPHAGYACLAACMAPCGMDILAANYRESTTGTGHTCRLWVCVCLPRHRAPGELSPLTVMRHSRTRCVNVFFFGRTPRRCYASLTPRIQAQRARTVTAN